MFLRKRLVLTVFYYSIISEAFDKPYVKCKSFSETIKAYELKNLQHLIDFIDKDLSVVLEIDTDINIFDIKKVFFVMKNYNPCTILFSDNIKIHFKFLLAAYFQYEKCNNFC